jgi:hypothetical protein
MMIQSRIELQFYSHGNPSLIVMMQRRHQEDSSAFIKRFLVYLK